MRQGLPHDEPVPHVGPSVNPGGLHNLEAAAGAPGLQVSDGEDQAPWEKSISINIVNAPVSAELQKNPLFTVL